MTASKTKAKHTPGPWRASETWRPWHTGLSDLVREPSERDANGNVFWGYSISGSSENGAPILPTLAAVHNFPENIHANARLIAAAPDLLGALQQARRDLISVVEVGTRKFHEAGVMVDPAERTYGPYVERIDAAIRKATEG